MTDLEVETQIKVLRDELNELRSMTLGCRKAVAECALVIAELTMTLMSGPSEKENDVH